MNAAHGNGLHPVDREIAVRFDSVCFSYGDVQVLEKASFHIHRGEFVAMVGPNGSGKTTALKLLFGLETPSAGTIELFGVVYGQPVIRKWRQSNVAYVPQQLPADQMFPITVRDIVRMGMLLPLSRYVGGKNAAAAASVAIRAMEQTGIADLASRPYRSLSGGQKRRVMVARALTAGPDLLVLDEPSANMDSESENRLYETLGEYKGKTTILIVTHDTEFVTALTDRVLCLGDGGIVQHRIETGAAVRHGGSVQEARVLHGENIPADDCW
ncbi:MAG: metal ABC transporter ATP-binding protein [Treponema sp.]|jgi:zinc transport system ATP-binding protein|nr:metal ABC transporter ATP-binding protein [Treponema sp.]